MTDEVSIPLNTVSTTVFSDGVDRIVRVLEKKHDYKKKKKC